MKMHIAFIFIITSRHFDFIDSVKINALVYLLSEIADSVIYLDVN